MIHRMNHEEVIPVIVGEAEKTFYVHKKVLCDASPFFASALNKEWLEKEDQAINLPEDRPMTVETYIHWIYSDKLVLSVEETKENLFTLQVELAHLYPLADKLGDIRLKNSVMDVMTGILDRHNAGPNSDAEELLLASVPPQSPMRKLLVDLYVHSYGIGAAGPESIDKFPIEFIAEIMQGLMERRSKIAGGDPLDRQKLHGCHYHEHNDKVPKCA